MHDDGIAHGKQHAIALSAAGQLHSALDACREMYRTGHADAEVLCLLGGISGATCTSKDSSIP